jgi:signal transduction histidine kinase
MSRAAPPVSGHRVLRAALSAALGWAAACPVGATATDAVAPIPIRAIFDLAPAKVDSNTEVRIRGVVTYHRDVEHGELVVEDATGGILIDTNQALPRLVPPGTLVEVRGCPITLPTGRRLRLTEVRELGAAPLPEPARVTYEELCSGRFQGRYVEMAGIVQSATLDTKLVPPRLLVRLSTPVGGADLWVLRFGGEDGGRLIDAEVRVRGVCFIWTNARRQLTGARLVLQDLSAVTVLRPGPADPFAAPAVSPKDLLNYRPDGVDLHRVHVRGVVTAVGPGGGVTVQVGGTGIRATLAAPGEAEALRPGDEVDLVGFPVMSGASAALDHAQVRVRGPAAEPAPLETSAEQIVRGRHRTDGDTDQRLVRLRGTLRAWDRQGGSVLLSLEDGGLSFQATLPVPPDGPAPEDGFDIGGVLSLTGICERTVSPRAHLLGGHPDGFLLRLRGPADAEVLRGGGWFTARRLAVVAGVVGAGLLAATAWALVLRERVRRRDAQLARQVRSRHEAEIAFQATLAERNRLACELHDSLQQHLTAAALQLDAAGLAVRHGAAGVGDHIAAARGQLATTQDELRRSLWDLRRQDRPDLLAELRDLGESMALGAGLRVGVRAAGEPRRLPETAAHELVRIVQEAVGNAVRHARPRGIDIAVEFRESSVAVTVSDDGRGFSLSEAARREGHYGLEGMRARAARLGGELRISSEPGRGTTVSLDVPLPRPEAERPA